MDGTEMPGNRVTVLPMGVSAEDFGPQHRSAEVRRRLLDTVGGTEQTRILLYAGRLAREKNIRLLTETMLALGGPQARGAPDYRLLVAGRGPLEAWLLEQARGLDIRIVLLGHVSGRKEFAELLANADAFIHPNPCEPFGITLLEAMCSELPMVAPCRGGVMDYCGAQNAWLAEPDGLSFAAAVRAVFGDEATRRARVAEARRTALAHDWDKIARLFFDTYDRFHQSWEHRRAQP
jgi:alpha-1,6-mannosyltransferase